jgi:hypothetical protein
VALTETMYFALQQRSSLVRASLLIPAFVKTQVSNSERNRPVELHDKAVEMPPQVRAYWDFMNAAVDAGMPPSEVAAQVFDAIKEERFYIMTHPRFTPVIQLRMESLLRAENPVNPGELFMKLMKQGR